MKRLIGLAILVLLIIEATLTIPGMTVRLSAQPPLPKFPEWKYEYYGPRLDSYLYRVITNKESRIAAFESGETDEVGDLEPPEIDRIRTNRPDAFFFLSQDIATYPLQLNLRRYPISELPIRQALAYIIDREGYVVPEVLKGLGVPIYSIVLPLYGKWYNPNLKPYEYSLQKAEQVLDKAGFVRGADGFRIDPKTNQPLRAIELITYTEGVDPQDFRIGQYLVRQAEKIGLRLTQTLVTTTVYTQRIPNQDFDVYLNGWSLGIYPTFMNTFWHSRNLAKLATNRYGVNDSRVDELADKFIFSPTEDDAVPILWKLQEVLHEIVPWIPIYSPISVTAYSGKVRGLVPFKLPGQQYPVGLSALTLLNLHTTDHDFGGSYRQSASAEFANLNPMYYLFTGEAAVLSRIYEPMTNLNPDNPYAARFPGLAKSWKSEVITVDGKQQTKITISFVDNATWHDGVPLTAEDLEWTINVAGNQWKTRRQFTDISSTMSKFIKTNLVDKYTIEVFIADTSWNYLVQILGLRVLAKHIYEKMTKEQAQKTDASVTPHPTVPGLTLLIGAGPFIMKEHLPGTSVALVWNPVYYRRHPGKTLVIDTRFDEDNLRITMTVSDYLKQAVIDAVITVTTMTSDGKVIKQVDATNAGNGVYIADLTGISTGSYKVNVKVSKPLAVGTLTKVQDFNIDFRPLWMRQLPIIAGIVIAIVAAALAIRLRRRRKATSQTTP